MIHIRCDCCGRKWSEDIPAIQPAVLPLRIRSIVCNCGADYQRINLSTPTSGQDNVKQA